MQFRRPTSLLLRSLRFFAAILLCGSQPVLSLEEQDHAAGYGQHDENDTRITEAPVQLGHVGKVHAVQSNDKSEWNENRRNDGEYAHDVVGPHAQTRDVQIHETACDIAVGLKQIHNS